MNIGGGVEHLFTPGELGRFAALGSVEPENEHDAIIDDLVKMMNEWASPADQFPFSFMAKYVSEWTGPPKVSHSTYPEWFSSFILHADGLLHRPKGLWLRAAPIVVAALGDHAGQWSTALAGLGVRWTMDLLKKAQRTLAQRADDWVQQGSAPKAIGYQDLFGP